MLLIGNSDNSKVFPDRLNDGAGMCGVNFAPSQCNLLLQKWVGSKPTLVLARGELDEMDRFSYLGSCNSPGGRVLEVSSRIKKARLAITNEEGSILSYGSETRPTRTEDTRGFLVFERRNARIWWKDCVNNSDVRRKIVGPRVQSLEHATTQNGEDNWGDLRMPAERLLRYALSSESSRTVFKWLFNDMGEKYERLNQ